MSDTPNPDLERRLAALELGNRRPGASTRRRSPLLAFLMMGLILAGGLVLYLFSQPEDEGALPPMAHQQLGALLVREVASKTSDGA